MKGHSDTVTGLALSPDGSFVVSNSMDNSLRVWDIRPFAPQERCIKMMVGHAHNFEKVFQYFKSLLNILINLNCLIYRICYAVRGRPMVLKSRLDLLTGLFTFGTRRLVASFTNCPDTMAASTMSSSTRTNQ